MKRLAVILCLLSVQGWAATYTATNSGAWTTPAIWSPSSGTPGTADTAINTNASITVTNMPGNVGTVTWQAGTISANNTIVNQAFTLSNCFVFGPGAQKYYLTAKNCFFDDASVVFSNVDLELATTTNEMGQIVQNSKGNFTIRLQAAGVRLTFTSCTKTDSTLAVFLNAAGASATYTNCRISASVYSSITITSGSLAFIDSDITTPIVQLVGGRVFETNSFYRTTSFPSINIIFTNNLFSMQNSTNILAIGNAGVTDLRNCTFAQSNSAFVFAGPNNGLHYIRASGSSPALTAIIASNCAIDVPGIFDGIVINTGNFNGRGFSLSAATITNSGTFIASNGTTTVTNLINIGSGTVSQMTSTIIFAGNCNALNFWNAQPNSPSASLTNAQVTIFGTLTGAAGASLDGNGATLVLSNPGTIWGTASNLTVQTNSRPLTATMGVNAGGKLNLTGRRGQD